MFYFIINSIVAQVKGFLQKACEIGSESNMKYYLQDIDTGIILRI